MFRRVVRTVLCAGSEASKRSFRTEDCADHFHLDVPMPGIIICRAM